MKAVQSCSPSAAEFLEMDRLLLLVESYDFIDKDLLAMECVLAKHTLADQQQELKTIMMYLLQLFHLKQLFQTW